MKQLRFSFENRSGHRLAAILDLPMTPTPAAYALFAHCFTCSKNLSAVGRITRSLAHQGLAVMRFDFTGLGDSEGRFSETTFSTNVSDLVDAARYLEANYGPPQLLIGHSMGGTAALCAAVELSPVRAVAIIGSPSDPRHVLNHLKDQLVQIMEQGAADVEISEKTLNIQRQFVEDVEKYELNTIVKNLRKALIILHSPVDDTVAIEHAARIFKAARHPKSFVSLERADHLLTDKRDAQYAGAVICAWANRYLSLFIDQTAGEGQGTTQVIARTGAEGFATDIQVNRHHLIADEPESVGGEDLGPSPYDYLTAGLGACTAMTLRMYADRKGWPLTGTTVRLGHRKIHAGDCSQCETKEGWLDEITREIELEGPLDEEKRSRLLEIADRCPVHRTLHSEISVKTSLVALPPLSQRIDPAVSENHRGKI